MLGTSILDIVYYHRVMTHGPSAHSSLAYDHIIHYRPVEYLTKVSQQINQEPLIGF